MNKQTKIIGALLGVALAAASGGAVAESTYGYDSTAAAQVYATARVAVKVTVPKLILLRVGASGAAYTTLSFAPTLTNGIIPGGVAPTNGSGMASGWDATAPTFASPAGQTVSAHLWTNSSGGATLAQSTSVTTPLAGISAANVDVSYATVTGSLPTPPATTTNGTFTGTATRNVLHSSDWTYSILGSVLDAAAAGVYEQITTYTATTL